MKIAKILNNNSQSFLDDLKRSSNVMVYAEKTDSYFSITKKDLLYFAETKLIDYFVTENIGSQGYTMVVR